jgi:hypothetical protein
MTKGFRKQASFIVFFEQLILVVNISLVVTQIDDDPFRAIALGNFFAGAIFVAIWIHTYSIRRLYKDLKVRRIMKVLEDEMD